MIPLESTWPVPIDERVKLMNLATRGVVPFCWGFYIPTVSPIGVFPGLLTTQVLIWNAFLKTALILSYIYITYKQVFPSRVCPWKPHMAKLPRRYGYGFSFVYTKAAWELVKFPDTEWSEDGEPWKRGVLTLDCPWRCMDDHRWRIWFWFLGEWLFNIGRPPFQVCYILLCCQRQVVYQWGLVLRTMCICQWPISICANIIQDTLLDATVTYRRFRWDRIKKPFVGFVGQQIFPRNPRTSWVDCSWRRLEEEMGAWMLCSTL